MATELLSRLVWLLPPRKVAAQVDSKDHVEIEREPAMAFTEEDSAGRISSVRVRRFRIEVIRQVERTYRQAYRVLWIHLEISPHARVDRKKVWEAF